jgi:RNA polymerase sigma-70 factor (ECF subfamily)
MAAGPAAGLALIDGIEGRGELRGYHLMWAARAELLVRMGERVEASRSFLRAIEACGNPEERAHLERRLAEAEAL